jgi:hypothetical protein
MTTPGETPSCLEEAADLLRKAAAGNARRLEDTSHLEETHPERRRLHAERLRIAEDLLAAAAIEAGLPPCYHLLHEHEREAP